MKTLFIKSSMERDPRYRQQTVILQEQERRFVRKIPAGPAAGEHLKAYAKNRALLTGALQPGSCIRILPCQENPDGTVDFPFCVQPTLEEILRGLSAEAYVGTLLAFKQALTEAFGTKTFHSEPDFRSLFGTFPEMESAEGMISLTVTDPDLRFDNVFFGAEAEKEKNGYYTLIDYEWVLSFPVPLPFVFYRALQLDATYRAFPETEQRRVKDALDIPETLEKIFSGMETAFLRSISPEGTRLDYYATHATPITRVNHRLDWMLRRTELASRSRLDLRRYADKAWYPVLMKPRETGVRIWENLRKAARKRNAFGLFCSLVLSLVRSGPGATLKKMHRWVRAGKAQKAFARSLELSAEERKRQQQERFSRRITFSILVPLYNTPLPFLEEMIESVREQTYSDWELCLADGSDEAHTEVGETCLRLAREDPRIKYRHLERNGGISENTNACMDMATGEYFVLFDHDDLLHPAALYENMKAICEQDADFLYSDEAVFASPHRDHWISTHFKPDYAPEDLLSNNYICHLSVFRAALLKETGRFRSEFDGSQDHDLILRLTGASRRVVHIPKLLYYWRSHAGSVASDIGAKTYAISAGQRAVADFLRTRGESVRVESTPVFPTLYRVHFPLPEGPSVRMVLWFTEDQNPEKYLKTLFPTLNYFSISVTVLRTGKSSEPENTLYPITWMEAGKNGLRSDLSKAAAAVKEDVLLFMDPELHPESGSWLREMLTLVIRKNIGAVGAREVFSDGTVRHGGLVTGMGARKLVGRSQLGEPAVSGGYFGQLAILRDVSAVSSECLMIRRDRFEEAGGFSEGYQDTLFDADLCLKLLEKGYRNVVTPFAEMKGGSRKHFSLDYGAEKASYEADGQCFRQTWQHRLERPDPCYNPNLTLEDADYSIRIC